MQRDRRSISGNAAPRRRLIAGGIVMLGAALFPARPSDAREPGVPAPRAALGTATASDVAVSLLAIASDRRGTVAAIHATNHATDAVGIGPIQLVSAAQSGAPASDAPICILGAGRTTTIDVTLDAETLVADTLALRVSIIERTRAGANVTFQLHPLRANARGGDAVAPARGGGTVTAWRSAEHAPACPD